MAKEFLLVDGYNIIHAWDELKELVEDVSLESARQKLMDVLSNYKGTSKATIILVFDGYLVKPVSGIQLEEMLLTHLPAEKVIGSSRYRS